MSDTPENAGRLVIHLVARQEDPPGVVLILATETEDTCELRTEQIFLSAEEARELAGTILWRASSALL